MCVLSGLTGLTPLCASALKEIVLFQDNTVKSIRRISEDISRSNLRLRIFSSYKGQCDMRQNILVPKCALYPRFTGLEIS